MPGTIPAITDPALTSSTTTPNPDKLSSRRTKAAVVDQPSVAPLVNAAPDGHPAAGVASLGAAQLIASTSHIAALVSTNRSARMTAAQPKKGPNVGSPTAKQEKELRKFVETDGHFSLVRNFHLADAFTLMNGFCGAQSLFASARFLLTSDPKHAWHALWFPLFGAIFDLLDGKVARWRNSSSMLGQELDSLADSLSFGAAPAFAAFTLGLRLPLDTLFLTMFVCAGIARLARFNVTTASIPHDSSGKARYFEGLPIPSSLILVGGMAICMLAGRIEGGSVPLTLTIQGTDGVAFFGRLRNVIPGANGGEGVPLGRFVIDLGPYVAKGLAHVPNLSKSTVKSVASACHIEVHKLSLLWGAWAMAMISKTLKVPKP